MSGIKPGLRIDFAEIAGSNNKKAVVGCIYRVPNSDSTSFIENIEFQLQILNMENEAVYIMGDFNLNVMNYDYEDKVKDLVDLMTQVAYFLS